MNKNSSKQSMPTTRRIDEKIKKKQASKKKKRFFALFLFVILISCVVWLALSPIFNIRSIVVEGVPQTMEQKVIEQSKIKLNVNVFKQAGENLWDCMFLKFEDNKQNILDNNIIFEDVDISFNFLGKITLTVTERKPYVIIENVVNKKKINVLVDKNYIVIENKKSKRWKNVITVTGLNIVNIQPKFCAIEMQDAKHLVIDKFFDMLSDEKIAAKKVVKAIKNVEIVDESKVSFKIDNVNVIMNDMKDNTVTEKRYKFDYLAAVLKKIGPDEKGVLDLTVGKDAVFKPDKKIK